MELQDLLQKIVTLLGCKVMKYDTAPSANPTQLL